MVEVYSILVPMIVIAGLGVILSITAKITLEGKGYPVSYWMNHNRDIVNIFELGNRERRMRLAYYTLGAGLVILKLSFLALAMVLATKLIRGH